MDEIGSVLTTYTRRRFLPEVEPTPRRSRSNVKSRREKIRLAASPLPIPSVVNPVLWLDAADKSTVYDQGGYVSLWLDKSGGNHHAYPSSGELIPKISMVDDKPAVKFKRSGLQTIGSPLGLAIDDAFVLCVFRVDDLDHPGQLFTLSHSPPPNDWGVHMPWGSSWFFDAGGSRMVKTNHTLTQGRIMTVGFYCSTSSSLKEVWIDGVSVGRRTSTFTPSVVSGGIQIGYGSLFYPATQSFQTYHQAVTICEFIVIDTDVSNTLREELEGYASHKWGCEASLPEVHPYKGAPP